MKNVIGRITISGENTIKSKRFGERMRSKAPGRVKKTGKVMEMASRLFQSIVLQMKDTVDRTIGIVDASGAVVACTDLPRIGEMREEAITEQMLRASSSSPCTNTAYCRRDARSPVV